MEKKFEHKSDYLIQNGDTESVRDRLRLVEVRADGLLMFAGIYTGLNRDKDSPTGPAFPLFCAYRNMSVSVKAAPNVPAGCQGRSLGPTGLHPEGERFQKLTAEQIPAQHL